MDPARIEDLDSVIANVLSNAVTAVGIASLVMLVIGGFQFFSAGADKEGTARARHTITYAIFGLVLAVSAWLILALFAAFFFNDPNRFSTFTICLPGGCTTL